MQQRQRLGLLGRGEIALALIGARDLAAGQSEQQRIGFFRLAEKIEHGEPVLRQRLLAALGFDRPGLFEPMQLALHGEQALQGFLSFAHQFPLTAQSANSAMNIATIEPETNKTGSIRPR